METSTDRISVIVPVYNVENYVEKCLSSIVKQTYRNMEIIVIIDGSTDKSEQICKKYAATDQRIIVISQDNQGLSAARNIGLDRMSGSYVMFVDGDDFLEEDCVSKAYKKITKTDSDIVMFDYDIMYKNRTVKRKISTEEYTLHSHIEMLQKNLDGEITDVIWNKIYRTELFKDLRFPKGINYEDIAMTYRLLERCKSFSYLQECLYHYIVRMGSITRSYEKHDDTEAVMQKAKKNKYIAKTYPELKETIMVDYFVDLLHHCNNLSFFKDKRQELYICRMELEEILKQNYYHLKLKQKIGVWLLFHHPEMFILVNKIRFPLRDLFNLDKAYGE